MYNPKEKTKTPKAQKTKKAKHQSQMAPSASSQNARKRTHKERGREIQEVPAFRDFWYQKGITNFETLFSAKSQIGSKNFLKSTFLGIFQFLKVQIQLSIRSFLTYFCQVS